MLTCLHHQIFFLFFSGSSSKRLILLLLFVCCRVIIPIWNFKKNIFVALIDSDETHKDFTKHYHRYYGINNNNRLRPDPSRIIYSFFFFLFTLCHNIPNSKLMYPF